MKSEKAQFQKPSLLPFLLVIAFLVAMVLSPLAFKEMTSDDELPSVSATLAL